jgi:hypothetical protein
MSVGDGRSEILGGGRTGTGSAMPDMIVSMVTFWRSIIFICLHVFT